MSTNNAKGPVEGYGYPSPFMTRFELADLLHLKTRTLHNHRHEIPGRRKISNEVFYDRTVISAWVAAWIKKTGGETSIWKYGRAEFEFDKSENRH